MDKRQFVSALNVQFSVNTRRLKDNALEQVFLSALYLIPDDDWVAGDTLRTSYAEKTHGYIGTADTESVLRRLVQQGKVDATGEPRIYKMSSKARLDWDTAEIEADRKITRIIERLIPLATSDHRPYEPAVIRIISQVAAELGDEAAERLLRRQSDTDISPRLLLKLTCEACDADARLNFDLLHSGVQQFFRSNEPDVHELLWRITENLFVMRLLGLDDGGRALSAEIFRQWDFTIDTNILVALLLPAHTEHDISVSTVKAIRTANVPMWVADFTLDELEEVLGRELRLAKDYIDRGDERWMTKTDSPFLQSFAASGCRTIDDYEQLFADFRGQLVQRFGMVIKEASSAGMDEEALSALETALRDASKIGFQEQRRKSSEVARHDAMLLSWTDSRRRFTSRQIWCLTLDGLLPSFTKDPELPLSAAVNPRSVIQWLTPLVNQDGVGSHFPGVFAEVVASKILPRATFMDAGDLNLILQSAKLRQMADADIERVVAKVRAESIRIDPTSYKGQADLGSIIASVALDPQSVQQQLLASSEHETSLMRDELDRSESARLNALHEASKLAQELDAERESNNQVRAQAKQISESEASFRFWIATGGWIMAAVLAGALVWFVSGRFGLSLKVESIAVLSSFGLFSKLMKGLIYDLFISSELQESLSTTKIDYIRK